MTEETIIVAAGAVWVPVDTRAAHRIVKLPLTAEGRMMTGALAYALPRIKGPKRVVAGTGDDLARIAELAAEYGAELRVEMPGGLAVAA